VTRGPSEQCERFIGSSGDLICDRCKSLWPATLHATGWLPSMCIERREPEQDPIRGGEVT
jgi:hypothetical protein